MQSPITLCFAFGCKSYKRGLSLYFKLLESYEELSKCLITIFERRICGKIHISRKHCCTLNQTLVKRTCQKSLRNNSICSKKKEAICKRNVIRHEKAKYKKIWSEPCLLNDGDECRLYHEFFKNFHGRRRAFL